MYDFDIYNDSGEDMPGGALCEWSGGYTETGAMKVTKPTGNSKACLVVNSPLAVSAGGAGVGSLGPRQQIVFDAEEGTPAVGGELGSVSGSWYAKAGNKGWRVLAGTAGAWADCVRADCDTVAGGGITGIDVVKSDLSVSYTDVPQLQIDYANGLSISAGANDTYARLAMAAASASVPGAVTTGAQSFAGVKTFTSRVYDGGTGLCPANDDGGVLRFPSDYFGDSIDSLEDVSALLGTGYNGPLVFYRGSEGSLRYPGAIFARPRSDAEPSRGDDLYYVAPTGTSFSAIGPTYNTFEGRHIFVGGLAVYEPDYDTSGAPGTGTVIAGKTGVIGPNAIVKRGMVTDLGSGSYGTVTTVSVTTANGVSASVANATTTPALTFTLGAITPSSVNTAGAVTAASFNGTMDGGTW